MPHICLNENFSWEQPHLPFSEELTFCAMPEPCLSLTFIFCFFCLQPCWTHLEQPALSTPALNRGAEQILSEGAVCAQSPQPVCKSVKCSMTRRCDGVIGMGTERAGAMRAVTFLGTGLVLTSWGSCWFCFLREHSAPHSFIHGNRLPLG